MAFTSTAMMVAALAVSVASTVYQYTSAKGAAADQRKLNQQYATSESAALVQNAEAQYGQGQNQIQYTDAAANQKTLAENMQAGADIAASQSGASGRGVTGNSVDAIQRDYLNRAAMYNSDVEFNRKASDEEIVQQMQGIQRGTQSSVNNVQSQMRGPAGPSAASLASGLVSDGMSAYGRYLTIKGPTPAPTSDPSMELSQADPGGLYAAQGGSSNAGGFP